MTLPASSVVPLLVAFIVATACGSGPSTAAKASPTPTAILDDHFGFLVGNTVRLESDPQPLFVLGIPNDRGGMVSPDGRHLAFWVKNELRVIDIAANARPRTLLSITGKEYALYIAWSSDSTGLVAGVNGPPANPAPDGPPAYTAVRAVDIAGGQPREMVRVANANVVPLAWDRQAHLIAAYEPSSSGARSYFVIDESGTVRRANAGPGIYTVEASPTGQHVLGRGDPNSVLRVWPRDSYESGVELRAAGDEPIATAAWRPGTTEVGVLFHSDRLELWDASGARRTIVLPVAPPSSDRYATLSFRADGKAVVISRQSGVEGSTETYAVAVDLASGRSVVFPMVGTGPLPGTSVRIS